MTWSPALGIAGWSDERTVVRDWADIEREKQLRESRENSSCWAFGSPDEQGDIAQQNLAVVRLISALGELGSGRRAVLKAIAEKQGITDKFDLDRLEDGTAEVKLQVPSHLRAVLCEIGLHTALAPINVMTLLEDEAVFAADLGGHWTDMEFEVALDSGAVIHVCSPADCPGYKLEESPGSRRKQKFQMGDGGTIPNLGQMALNLTDEVADRDLCSVFQIAAVTRPLMSVGKICDEGHKVEFDKEKAVIKHQDGSLLATFLRQPGGLYVAKMKLRNPLGFTRPE